MAEDTAVLEPDTTEALPETDEDTANDELETEGSEETPETEEGEAETFTAEQLEERIKAAREEVEAEIRARAEEEAQAEAAKQRRTQAQQLRQGKGLQQLNNLVAWAHKQGEDGNEVRLNPEVLNTMLQGFELGVFQEQSDAWKEAFDGYLNKSFKDFKPDRELSGRIVKATAAWNPLELVHAQFDVIRAAVREELEPKIREEIEAELRDEKRTKGLKETTEKRATQPKPTPVAGNAGNTIRIGSMHDADRAFNQGQIDINEYRKQRQRFGVR